MSRTLPSPLTKTLPTPTDTLVTTEFYNSWYNHTRMDSSTSLTSLTDDLQYTIEYASQDWSLPYMDIGHPHPRWQIHICLHKTDKHQPLCPLQFLCPLILQRQCIRCLTRLVHIICSPNIYKMDTPWERKIIMDSVKQKLENPNKLTLKQFYRLHPWQHPSLYTPPSLKISINP